MNDFGSDVSVSPDLSFNLKSGGAVVVEALARRLQTPRGGLLYALDYGWDVREIQLARVSSQSLFRWKAAIEQECLQDERVSDVTAHLTFDSATGAMLVELEAVLFDASVIDFKLTIQTSDLTLELLG